MVYWELEGGTPGETRRDTVGAVLRRSSLLFNKPGPGSRANEAIKVASEVPSEDVNAELSVLRREIIRLKPRRFEVASESPSEDVNAELTFLRREIISLEACVEAVSEGPLSEERRALLPATRDHPFGSSRV
jgi:hypothetical protein